MNIYRKIQNTNFDTKHALGMELCVWMHWEIKMQKGISTVLSKRYGYIREDLDLIWMYLQC